MTILIAGLVIAVGAIAVLSGFFAGQDQAGVGGGATGPGLAFRDQGDVPLAAGAPRPVYDSDPPTSGPHTPEAVTRTAAQLTVGQELEALAAGNVVLAYGSSSPPPALRALASYSPALVLAGQAVILDRLPGTSGVVGLAWTHLLRVSLPSDPRLRQFVSFWLGRGAPGRH